MGDMMKKSVVERNIANIFEKSGKSVFDKLLNLYYLYDLLYVKTYDDFNNSPEGFYSFLLEHYDCIVRCLPGRSFDRIMNECASVREWLKYCIKDVYVKNYSDIVSEIKPSSKSVILDVGAGNIPTSSIIIAKDAGRVGAMDKRFRIPNKTLNNLNVDARRELFNARTDIDGYDMVVGRFPCSAIDSIVYVCNKYNKPYFIETCDCEIPSPEVFYKRWSIDKSVQEIKQFWKMADEKIKENSLYNLWQIMLPELDKNIQFNGLYAYNMGSSNDDVEKLIAYIKVRNQMRAHAEEGNRSVANKEEVETIDADEIEEEYSTNEM